MPTEVLLAVLFAAAMHAGWNALVKINAEPIIAMGLIMLCTSLVALVFIPFVDFPTPEIWPFLLVTLVLHFGYKYYLVKAYAQGDFGQIYPIARGSGPLWVLLLSLVVFDVTFSGTQIIAIILIIFGIASLAHFKPGKSSNSGIYFALVTGMWIAGYTMVDGYVVNQIGQLQSYVVWLFFFDGLIAAVWAYQYNSRVFLNSLSQHWFVAIGGGLMSIAAYALCLWAMTQAPVAMVAALRETSVLFGAMLGSWLFKEAFGIRRWACAAFIFSGLVLVKLS